MLAADALVLALVLAGIEALRLGGYRFNLAGLRISVSDPWRPWLWASVVLALRIWWYPRVPRPQWIWSRPLALDEVRLFDGQGPRRESTLREWLAVIGGFTVLVAAFTWPQIANMGAVPDLGDPLFSIWRLAWVAHQITINPLTLFDANIFHPERLTLAYSDAMLVPGLAGAPFFWLGFPRVGIYNVLLLSGFVFSGVTMYLLVRALTGRRDAAAIAGVVFMLHPYRYEHYSHLELQITMWMPLALWALHRTFARGQLRDGLLTGLAFALQMLSSLYYGLYFAVYLVVVGAALWIGRRVPLRPLLMLSAGAALAGVLVAPVAAVYYANRPMMGDRDIGTVQFYSAEGSDYLKPHRRNLLYGRWSAAGHPERQLFPNLSPVLLAAIGLVPPVSAARLGYAAALAVAIDGSFGLNGLTFPWLRDHGPGFAGLRVPARFSLLAGMSLAVLGGYGASRILTRWPRWRSVLTVMMVTPVMAEAIPRVSLVPVWSDPPAIYGAFAGRAPSVLAEFPVPADADRSWWDARYLYFSTFHWQRLVNGNSGFSPASYAEFLEHAGDFPSDAALLYLRERGVEYIAMHGRFTRPTRYASICRVLDARPDLERVAVAPWQGSESRLYRFRRE